MAYINTYLPYQALTNRSVTSNSQASAGFGHDSRAKTCAKRQSPITGWIQSKRREIDNSHDGDQPIQPQENIRTKDSINRGLSLFRKASCLPKGSQRSVIPEDLFDDDNNAEEDILIEELLGATTAGKKSKTATAISISGRNLSPTVIETPPIPVFMRTRYPESVSPNSPIKGISDKSILRVCFRVGDIFRVARDSALENPSQEILFEIFARVQVSSWETTQFGCKQFFTLSDLFTTRPPYLKAELNILRLMDSDDDGNFPNNEFVGAHKEVPLLCRGVGIVRRDPISNWMIQLFRIMPTTWDIVEHRRSIVSMGS